MNINIGRLSIRWKQRRISRKFAILNRIETIAAFVAALGKNAQSRGDFRKKWENFERALDGQLQEFARLAVLRLSYLG